MYCSDCRKKLNGNENYCPECGKKRELEVIETNSSVSNTSSDNYRTTSIVLGIISLVGVLLVVFSPVSLILSIIGLVLAIKANKNVENVVGIVLNGVGLFLSFIITAVMVFILSLAIRIYKYGAYDIGEYLEEKVEQFHPYESSNEDNYGDNF